MKIKNANTIHDLPEAGSVCTDVFKEITKLHKPPPTKHLHTVNLVLSSSNIMEIIGNIISAKYFFPCFISNTNNGDWQVMSLNSK